MHAEESVLGDIVRAKRAHPTYQYEGWARLFSDAILGFLESSGR